ncbi:anti-sigma factor antagonist [Streptomyces sp. IB2014 011-12]|nr:anti-sigma factor antagonist [Streptomyces sp. IB2014 011-12]
MRQQGGDHPWRGFGPLPVVAPRGEFDFESPPSLQAQIESAVAASGGVVLDASGITFADSMFLVLILTYHQQADLRIVSPSPKLTRLFSIRGVDAVLDIYPSLDAAQII